MWYWLELHKDLYMMCGTSYKLLYAHLQKKAEKPVHEGLVVKYDGAIHQHWDKYSSLRASCALYISPLSTTEVMFLEDPVVSKTMVVTIQDL